jgi:AraC-like DNA-binding protein
MMQPRSDFADLPELDYEGWRNALRPKWGRYSPEAVDRRAFIGRARSRSLCGFVAIDLGCNAHRVERTQRDVRLDGVDHCFVLFQVAGGSTIIQNDRVVQLSVGDAALVDSARPGTHISEERCGQWTSLQLPRQSLASHLGFDAQGGVLGRGETAAGRMLFELVRDADTGDGSTSSPADFYMQLAVHDLIGALFAPSDPVPSLLHADKLFKRICHIIKDHFGDPAFGPCEVAAEAGISLRYLQKFFTARGTTCTHFINSVRLDHAAYLLHRRATLNTGQPISGIAYDSGVSDYTHFARIFRRRFGHSPGAHAGTPLRSGAPPYG